MTTLGRTSWRGAMARASRWLNGASYLQKWLFLGVLIGTMAGVGAIVFYEALVACTHFFLGTLAGYHVPTPTGEGNHRASATFTRPWALPLVVGLGALLGAILVFRFAPEAEGHGTDAAISAVHHNPAGYPLPGRGGQDRGVRPHHRIGRIGWPRGPHRPDQRRLRLAAWPGSWTSAPPTPASPWSPASGRGSGPSSVHHWAAPSWPPRSSTVTTSTPRRCCRASWPPWSAT